MPETLQYQSFDRLAERYDKLIDWPARLNNEAPFFRRLFESHQVRRVADVACGTGHHAAMFASWGLDVVGSDISPAMVDQCLHLHGKSDRLKWDRRSFTEPWTSPGTFDAVVCLGNSLALANDEQTASYALAAMFGMLRPGGVGVMQLLNLSSIREGPALVQKVRRIRCNGKSIVFTKAIHRCQRRAYMELLEIEEHRDPVFWRAESIRMLRLERPEVEQMIRDVGGALLGTFGSYGEEPFDELQSSDLIVVWWRPFCG